MLQCFAGCGPDCLCTNFARASVQVRSTLIGLGRAVKGLALMSAELDAVGSALFDGKVPDAWLKRSFPSLKPLGAYMKEVHDRLAFFQQWIDHGQPVKFWLSGFFFTQAFLTGSKQNYARKKKIPIDSIDFDFITLDNAVDTQMRPDDGVLTYGLFLEGCTWNYTKHVLDESEPKVRAYTLSIERLIRRATCAIWLATYTVLSFCADCVEVVAATLHVFIDGSSALAVLRRYCTRRCRACTCCRARSQRSAPSHTTSAPCTRPPPGAASCQQLGTPPTLCWTCVCRQTSRQRIGPSGASRCCAL